MTDHKKEAGVSVVAVAIIAASISYALVLSEAIIRVFRPRRQEYCNEE